MLRADGGRKLVAVAAEGEALTQAHPLACPNEVEAAFLVGMQMEIAAFDAVRCIGVCEHLRTP